MSPNRLRSPAQRVAKTIMTSPISPRILRKKAQQKAQKYADEGVASPAMASPAPSTPSGDNLQTPRHENWLQMTPASAPAYNRYQRKDFKIHEKCLGEGAFAKVVMGTHIPTRQQVAVKIIDKTKLPDCMRPYVMNEPEVLRRLFKHDNIVKLVLADEDERYIYLFLQFMRGGELYARVESQGSLPEAEAKAIMAQLVDAIAFCHAQGICHRDLKLENILVQGQVQSHVPVQPIKSLTMDGGDNEAEDDLYEDEDEADFLASNSRKLPTPASATGSEDDLPIKVLLIDFGFAGVMSNGGPDNHIFTDHPGSVCYAAPELIFGKPYKGCPSDIYSLGVVLYTMLYGRYPFFSEDKRTMVYMLMKEDPIFDQGVASAQVEDLLRKMLAKQPEDRPTIEEVRRHSWLSEFFPVVVSKKQQQSVAVAAEEPVAVHQSGSAIRGISASVSKASQVIKTHVSRVSSTTRDLLEKSSSGALSPILSSTPKTHASRAVAAANGGCGTAGTAQPGSPARRRLSFAA